jgi:hypothetical protein
MIALAGGCASPAHYVERKADSGVVAIPNNSNVWPFYHMRSAEDLIKQHVGPNFEIVEQYQFKTGQTTRNDQQTTIDQMQNKRHPNQVTERQNTTGIVTTQDTTEWRIVYQRRQAPGMYNQPAGGVAGVAPAGGFTAQGPPPGTIPSVLPAGGTMGGTMTGPTGSFR